jgi:hypothetical protein
VNTVVKTIMKIRINLTAVNGGQGITALKDSCYGPAGGSATAMNRGALLIFSSILSGNINIQIRKNRMIPLEVKSQKKGAGSIKGSE